MSEFRRRILMQQPSGVLPIGYTELEYIQSSGGNAQSGAYIDTGITPTEDMRFEVDFSNAVNVCAILGGGFQTDARFHLGTSNTFGFGDSYAQIGLLSGRRRCGNIKGVLYDLDTGEQLGRSWYSKFGLSLATILLFTTRISETSKSYYSNGLKIYSCKLYQGDITVRNLIPCVTPGGDIGMYDTVSKTFFGNLGTGSFIAGY